MLVNCLELRMQLATETVSLTVIRFPDRPTETFLFNSIYTSVLEMLVITAPGRESAATASGSEAERGFGGAEEACLPLSEC